MKDDRQIDNVYDDEDYPIQVPNDGREELDIEPLDMDDM